MTEGTNTAAPNLSPGMAVFDLLARSMQARFDGALGADGGLFDTDAPDLGPVFLDHLPPAARQFHACSCCLTFLRRFGRLATVTKKGSVASALWNPDAVPVVYRPAVAAMAAAVTRAPIGSVFLAASNVWGTPQAGGFAHFALAVPEARRYRGVVLSAAQAMAARREDFRTLSHGLEAFDRRTVAQALTLLRAEALYRAEKVIGPAEFLLRLHDELPRRTGPARDALIWQAVSSAPPGFCTPRSAMIGTLLEDVAAGRDFATVKARFDAKMHPLQYQRPQAAPRAGNIAQAERLFAQLGLEPALRRRFARLEEVPTVWKPAAALAQAQTAAPAAAVSGVGSIFAHLKAKGADAPAPDNSLAMPPQAVTWAKFSRDVLPEARRIRVFTGTKMAFCGLVTAVDPAAPPLLQWDREDARNPVSSYIYVGGSPPAQWGLPEGEWVAVTGITLLPTLWAGDGRFRHHGPGAVLILDGAQDRSVSSLCLFPETLRSELHGVRAVVEAYSKSRSIEGADEGSANGLLVGQSGNHMVRVESAIGTACYTIDRWE